MSISVAGQSWHVQVSVNSVALVIHTTFDSLSLVKNKKMSNLVARQSRTTRDGQQANDQKGLLLLLLLKRKYNGVEL